MTASAILRDVEQSLQISSEPLRVKLGIRTEFCSRNPFPSLPQFSTPQLCQHSCCCKHVQGTLSRAKKQEPRCVGNRFFNQRLPKAHTKLPEKGLPLAQFSIASSSERQFWLTFLVPAPRPESPLNVPLLPLFNSANRHRGCNLKLLPADLRIPPQSLPEMGDLFAQFFSTANGQHDTKIWGKGNKRHQ